jgi:hypothetical protein
VNIETDLSDESLADLEWALAAKKKVDFISLLSMKLNSSCGLERVLWITESFPNANLIVGNLYSHNGVEKFAKAGAVGIAVGNPDENDGAFSIPMFSALRSLYLNTHPRPHVFLCNEITAKEEVGVALTAGADFVCVDASSIKEMTEIEFSLKKQVYLCGAKTALSLSPQEQEYIIVNE